KKACGHCHRDDLAGGGSEAGAPALKGPIFTFRWNDQPLSEMFLTIGTTMPQNAPDTLTPQTVADIIGFLLRSNEIPAGPAELEGTLAPLKAIMMVQRSGADPSGAQASDVTLVAPGGMRCAMDRMASDIETRTGHKVKATIGSGGATHQQVVRGEPFDV